MGTRRTIPDTVVLIASLSILIGLGCGCGGGGGGGVAAPALAATFTSSGTAGASDLIRLRGGASAGDVLDVEVVIGGPTSSSDLYAVAFDLVIADTTVVRFEHADAGGALTIAGAQSRNVQASMTGNRLVVGVSKLGGGSGNGVAAGESVVVTLTLKVLRVGATTVSFAGRTVASDPTSGPAALDSSGQVVPSVRFDTQAVTVTGQ